MNETEKTKCFDNCQFNHDCFGGWLDGAATCDREMVRIKNDLNIKYPDNHILFYPKNVVGILFKVLSSPEKVILVENGEISQL